MKHRVWFWVGIVASAMVIEQRRQFEHEVNQLDADGKVVCDAWVVMDREREMRGIVTPDAVRNGKAVEEVAMNGPIPQ